MAAAVAAPPAGRGRGAGKKGRAKGKGKAKKGKFAMKKAPLLDAEGNPIEKPKKEPKMSLKQMVESEIGERNIEDVIKEARANVLVMQDALAKAQQEELTFETDIQSGKMKMTEFSAKVDTCVHEETMALEKLKAARRELIEAQRHLTDKKLEVGQCERSFQVLEAEGEMQAKTADLMKQKEEVKAAKEAAKKALDEAKIKEAQVAAAMKEKRQALALTDDPEAAARAKAETERAVAEEQARKDAKHAGAHAEKDLKAELKALDHMRANRDKERAKAFKEAAGLGKVKRAHADGAAGASPAKAAKIHDVD